MPLRPWQPLPNLGRYYKRLAQQTLKDTFSFWWQQVLAASILGVLTAIVGRKYHWIPQDCILVTIGISLIPYAVIMVIVLIVNAIRAPVKLANQEAERYAQLQESARQRLAETESARDRAAGEFEALKVAVKRDPVKEHHYHAAEQAIAALSDTAKQVLRQVWSHEKLFVGPGRLVVPGLSTETIISALDVEMSKCPFIIKRTGPYLGGHQDIWWEIVPGYKEVLGELLYADTES